MSEETEPVEAVLAILNEIGKNYQEAAQLARQAIIALLRQRGYTDAQIAALVRRRARERRKQA